MVWKEVILLMLLSSQCSYGFLDLGYIFLQACLPLDTLEELVVKYFSSIPNNNLPADDFSQYKLSFDTDKFNKLYWVKPISDKIEVSNLSLKI